MDFLLELLKLIIPAGAVLYGMYLVVVSFLSKEREKLLVDLKSESTQVVLPIRLQAAERLCLLLERISPTQLVRRANPSQLSAEELHLQLLSDIREEFNHNASQQVYFSQDTWNAIKVAVEEVSSLIHLSRQSVEADASGLDLAKVIFSHSFDRTTDPIQIAIGKVKAEVSLYF
ncbi:MAG: hypothetical protein RL407_1127 [Bacteroidota bacterium]|jgi:hypothetical protein|nr:hypothetical protein [Cyclobacteriaceae bacterium]